MKLPDCFMVVDDDRTTTLLCKTAFRRFSEQTAIKLYTVPEIALKAIKEEYNQPGLTLPTVLFLDINMPSMSGWEFLEMYKDLSDDIHKQFTIFIFSSSVDKRDKEKAENNLSISGFISKPLTVNSLKEIFKQE